MTVGSEPQSLEHLLEDVRSSLGVPLVSSFLRTAAEHPAFGEAWTAVRPAVQTPAFVRASSWLRSTAAESVRSSFFVSDHLAALLRLGMYDDISKVKACIVGLDWTAAREMTLLGLMASGDAPCSAPTIGNGSERYLAPRYPAGTLSWWGAGATGELDEKTSAVLAQVTEALAADAGATVFGVLSAWPGYLQYAWRECTRLRSGAKWSVALRGLVEAAAGASRLVPADWAGFPSDKLADLREHLQPVLHGAGEHLLSTAVLRLGLAVPDGSLGLDQVKPVHRTAPAGDHTARKRPPAAAAESAASG